MIPRGPTPYGYERLSDGNLAVLEAQAKVVRAIFSDYARCSTLAEIARDLNDRSVCSPQPSKARANGSKPRWLRGSVWSILRNPVYKGFARTPSRHYVRVAPALVDAETWSLVQRALSARSARRSR